MVLSAEIIYAKKRKYGLMVCEFSKTCNRYRALKASPAYITLLLSRVAACVKGPKNLHKIKQCLTARLNVNSSFSKQEFTLNRQETTGKSTPNKQGEMVKNIDSKT